VFYRTPDTLLLKYKDQPVVLDKDFVLYFKKHVKDVNELCTKMHRFLNPVEWCVFNYRPEEKQGIL
jgi:hypothetical protein